MCDAKAKGLFLKEIKKKKKNNGIVAQKLSCIDQKV